MFKIKFQKRNIKVKAGPFSLFIKRNFKVIYTLNDILLGLEFLIGSVLFLFPSMEILAVCLFITGSTQMLIRPVIRLFNEIQLK